LTTQVARLAWAVELTQIDLDSDTPIFEGPACAKCNSQLVLLAEDTCSACREPKKEESDA
jgi:hypothetical protein